MTSGASCWERICWTRWTPLCSNSPIRRHSWSCWKRAIRKKHELAVLLMTRTVLWILIAICCDTLNWSRSTFSKLKDWATGPHGYESVRNNICNITCICLNDFPHLSKVQQYESSCASTTGIKIKMIMSSPCLKVGTVFLSWHLQTDFVSLCPNR